MNVAGLIVGLGNPGRQYENTRHNMGFLTVDALLQEARAVTPLSGGKFRCELWKAELPVPVIPSRTGRGGRGEGRAAFPSASGAASGAACGAARGPASVCAGIPWLVAKPETFMNLSGDCVQPLAAWHRITPDRLLVIHDELDLPPGRMKFKKGGGNAGHNGLKSICERLGTPEFYRLRLGIGRSPHGGDDTINRVLGRVSSEEQLVFERMLPTALRVIELFAAGAPDAAMREANGYKTE